MNPFVSICCITYNHEKYIRDAIEGFLNQKTNFPFEVLIHDDASTDGTANIIREYEAKYPQIIKPIYQTENQYSKGIDVSIFNYSRAKGKYIALCEGDDYWTDPYKLQKQVDFLEKNPDFGLVYTKCKLFNNNKVIGGRLKKDELFYNNKIPALTCVFKTDLIWDYLNIFFIKGTKWKMGDYPLWLWFYVNSKIGFVDKVTATYRVLPESASHFTDGNKRVLFNINSFEIANFFAIDYFNIKDYNLFLNRNLFVLALSCLKHKSYLLSEVLKRIRSLSTKRWYNKILLLILKNVKISK